LAPRQVSRFLLDALVELGAERVDGASPFASNAGRMNGCAAIFTVPNSTNFQ
jgi:hypothetical protein